jgi:hypothetical protein
VGYAIRAVTIDIIAEFGGLLILPIFQTKLAFGNLAINSWRVAALTTS